MTDELSEVVSEYKLSESRPESLSSSLSLRPGEIRGSGTCQRVDVSCHRPVFPDDDRTDLGVGVGAGVVLVDLSHGEPPAQRCEHCCWDEKTMK